MNEGLFRKEAIDARRGEGIGGIQLQLSLHGWIFLSLGVLVIVPIGALLQFGSYTRHELADGAAATFSFSINSLTMTTPIVGLT
jgi:membrane fusion protein